MNSFVSFSTLVVGLTLGASALAQAPGPGAPPNPPSAQIGAASSFVRQSSRIRAFNPGPDGQLRSLYLSNGSVVDLPPDLSLTMSSSVRKGERVSVSGLRSTSNGQIVLTANSVTLNGQTFVSRPGPGAVAGGDRPAPPPPGAGPGREPRRGPDMARSGPPSPGADGLGQPPPPPRLRGPAPACPQGQQPPVPAGGGAPLPPIDSMAPAQPNLPRVPLVDQPAAPSPPTTQPLPNGPAL